MADDLSEIQNTIAPGERPMAIAAIEILLRTWRKGMECFPGDDLETILVFLTVASASAGRHLRDADVLAIVNERPLPDHLHRPISGRAVAESTGLPRETVRRKLEALVAEGRLVKDGRGVRTISGTLASHRNLEFARFLIQEFSAAPRRLARFDPG